jgi:predicted enzyme related to lactoylglutathione lyase
MSLAKIDHFAIEVADLDYYIERLVGTGGMRLLRRATAKRTGTRMAMVGDPTGVKLELIENKDAGGTIPRFLHVAFRSRDVDAAAASLVDKGWKWERGPIDLEDAQARSVLLSDARGFELQLLTYQPTSPDVVEWSSDKSEDLPLKSARDVGAEGDDYDR